MLRFNLYVHARNMHGIDFNTSYVTVQLFWSLELVLDYRNFNTSYVTVQLRMVGRIDL